MKPALFIRNVRHATETEIRAFLKPYDSERVQLVRTSRDGPLDMVVVYFASEKSAFDCLSALRNVGLNGKTLAVSFRYIIAFR